MMGEQFCILYTDFGDTPHACGIERSTDTTHAKVQISTADNIAKLQIIADYFFE